MTTIIDEPWDTHDIPPEVIQWIRENVAKAREHRRTNDTSSMVEEVRRVASEAGDRFPECQWVGRLAFMLTADATLRFPQEVANEAP